MFRKYFNLALDSVLVLLLLAAFLYMLVNLPGCASVQDPVVSRSATPNLYQPPGDNCARLRYRWSGGEASVPTSGNFCAVLPLEALESQVSVRCEDEDGTPLSGWITARFAEDREAFDALCRVLTRQGRTFRLDN